MARDDIAAEILGLHRLLRAEPELAPSPTVNRLFGRLVQICTRHDPAAAHRVLTDERIRRIAPQLRSLCADGESELEKAWAARVLVAPDPSAELARFPYVGNYQELIRLELHALAGAGHEVGAVRRICFVGGGPLPLTALQLHRATSAAITIVDRDSDAIELAAQVVHRLGRPTANGGPGPFALVRADAQTGEGLASAVQGCDVVMLAALVGLDREGKRRAIAHLAEVLAPGVRVVMRSAEGLRTLLYPMTEVCDVRDAGLQPELLVHPLGEVVNSVLVARRR